MLVFWGIALRGRLTRKWGFGFGVAGFVGLAVLAGAGVTAITSAARQEIDPILAAELRSDSVNGKPFAQGAALVALLRDLRHPWAHHSHALAPLRARITTSAGAVELSIARDSGIGEEYWVFYPGFEATKSNAIGHIFTDLLDGLTPSPAPEPASSPLSNPPGGDRPGERRSPVPCSGWSRGSGGRAPSPGRATNCRGRRQ